jgi:2-polyprenyl-6-methoxyphenol hydroxylase-like FAD-dependent oxidoreductase
MTNYAVVIVGGGPTGLMLAGELALGVAGSRAGGLHSRTIEVLDQRGIADRFLSQGRKAQAVWFSGVSRDINDFPTRHPYVLALWQTHIERMLAGWIEELGVPVYRGREVTGLTQNEAGVDVELKDGHSLRAQYLVGCDGGRSLVRKAAGIAFPGSDPTTSNLIAEAELAEEPPEWGIRRDALGIHSLSRHEDGQRLRILVAERNAEQTNEPTLKDLSEALLAVYGSDYGVHSPTSISRFTDATRQASTYRTGRVLVAGDAAHVHPPDGWPGPPNGCAGCGEPGMEAGAGGQKEGAGKPPRHLPRRAPPGCCPRIAKHDGFGRASPRRRTDEGTARHHFRAPQHG